MLSNEDYAHCWDFYGFLVRIKSAPFIEPVQYNFTYQPINILGKFEVEDIAPTTSVYVSIIKNADEYKQ